MRLCGGYAQSLKALCIDILNLRIADQSAWVQGRAQRLWRSLRVACLCFPRCPSCLQTVQKGCVIPLETIGLESKAMIFRRIFLACAMTGAIVLAGIPTLALQISQIEFDLYLPAGTTGNYAFRVVNNETRAQEVKVYLSDWLRTPTGENDFIPLNGARWLVPRTLRAGEKLEIVYRIKRLSADITVTGSYVTGSPASRGEVTGARRLSPAEIEKPALSTVEGIVRITREIATASPTGDSVTVRVSVHVLQDVAGLRIDEVFSSHVDIEALESAGGTFDAVGRSNGDWIDVRPSSFHLAGGEAQEVTFSIQVPPNAAGTYWGMIFVEGSPRPEEHAGATVLAIERFGVKVYETVPGTEVLTGEVTRLQKIDDDPLSFEISFKNTGNVQLRPKGRIEITGSTGKIVQTLSVVEFFVLPGAVRQVKVVGQEKRVSSGRYFALAVLDIGNPEYLVAGQLVFAVKELALIPIGDSVNPPQDLDGDGLYEDTNGDGRLTLEDPALLAFFMDSPAVQANTEAFDFNKDGRADFGDVTVLKSIVERQKTD